MSIAELKFWKEGFFISYGYQKVHIISFKILKKIIFE
jgi:hypothetical protein